QAAAQVGLAQRRGLQRVVEQRGALAVGAAQVGFAGVGLDHGHVAAQALGFRLGIGLGLGLGRGRGRQLFFGQRARDLAGLAAAGGVDLGPRQVGRARRQGVAAGAVAVGVVPAVQLLALA